MCLTQIELRVQSSDNRTVIFSDGKITQDGVEIREIELLEYKIKTDQNLGQYSIITALVDADQAPNRNSL